MTPPTPKPGWKTYRFDQIAINVTDRVDPAETDLEYYVGLEHLDPESLKIRRWGSPSDVIGQKLGFRKGDIIFGKRRAYQRKLSVADFDGICSAHAMVLRPKTNVVLPEFLPLFMQSDLFMNRALEISVGSLSPTINWRTLAQQEFPLPPLEEQPKIENVLSSVEEVIIQSINLQEKLSLLRDSFTWSVFTQKNPLSKESQIKPIGNMAEIVVGQSPKGDAYNSDGVGLPLLNGPTEFGRIHPTPIQWSTSTPRVCKPNDILFCVRGSTTGRQNIADQKYCIGRGLVAIRGIKNKTETTYLKIVLEAVKESVFHEARTAGSTFPNITSKRLKEWPVPFPSIENQRLLAIQFTEITDQVSKLEFRINQMKLLKKILLEDVLGI